MSAAQTQQWSGLSPHAAERVASTILLHCLIHKPHRELKNLGLRHEVAIRGRHLLTVSLQDWVGVSDVCLGSVKGAMTNGIKGHVAPTFQSLAADFSAWTVFCGLAAA